MGYLREVELGTEAAPFVTFRDYFGFVPNVIRAQTLLPRVIEAQAVLGSAVLYRRRQLSQICKERMMLVLAAVQGNAYCVTVRRQMLILLGAAEEELDQWIRDYRQAALPPADKALLDFAVQVAMGAPAPGIAGWNDEALLETVLIVAWSNFRRAICAGLGPKPDFPPIALDEACIGFSVADAGPKAALRTPPLSGDFAPFALLREQLGFVPEVFQAQTLRPDALEAQSQALNTILFTSDVLSRSQKEGILGLASTAARDQPLLNFTSKLSAEPASFGAADIDVLRKENYSDEQILEAVVVTALGVFLNTMQLGLAAGPGFIRLENRVNPLPAQASPSTWVPITDPDAGVIARVQGGDLDAFEDLVNRHTRRVYRTLIGILGNPEEACDAVQDTFLKAYRHLGQFQGRSKFSTWVVSIAHNTGIELLRARKPVESLEDERAEAGDGYRPRQFRAWEDTPEQLYSKSEVKALVEASVMKLPAKYRVVVMLRDIEHLSMEETAVALGLGIPALKSRLVRGRLMVREALAPHFGQSARGGVA